MLIGYVVLVAGIAHYRTMQLGRFGGDEGLFAEMARLLVRGGVLYQDMWDIKPPGLFLLLAPFVAILGNTVFAIRLGTLMISLAFIGVMTTLTHVVTRNTAATWITFALATMYSGYNEKPETVFAMMTLGAAAALCVIVGRGRILYLLAGGLLFAWAVWTKQPIIVELPVLLALAAYYAPIHRWRAAGITLAGFAIGCGLLLLWLASNGVLEEFWFYTFAINRRYVMSNSGLWHFDEAAPTLFQRYFVGTTIPLLMPLLILGGIAVFINFRHNPQRRLVWLILLWLLLAFGGAAIGRSLRADYFQETFPPFILFIALAVTLIRAVHWQIALMIVMFGLFYRFNEQHIDPFDEWHVSPSTDREAVVAYVIEHTEPGDCIWTWGFIGQINYLSDRNSCNSAPQEGYMMDAEAFPIYTNRRENIDDLLAKDPALHVVLSPWSYYPELQTYVDRYVTGLVLENERFQVYSVDRSMWHPTDVNFNGEIALIGYDLPAAESFCPGAEVPMSLTWRQMQTPQQEYQFFVQVLTADETARIAGQDGLPEEDRPTYTWVNTGEAILGGPFTLTLPEAIEPGAYPLVVGLYDVETLDRSPVFDANGGAQGTYSHLQTIQIDACETDE
jgi:hypothetical protein